MKTKIYILTLLLSLLTVGGCTQNDGHIGRLFGAWVMTEMTVDGTPKLFPEDEYTTVAFQSSVVRFDLHEPRGLFNERWGSWVETGSRLRLDFTHSDDKFGPGSAIYQAPEWLDFPPNTVIDLTIAEASGGRLTLVYNADGGKVIIYKFERTW